MNKPCYLTVKTNVRERGVKLKHSTTTKTHKLKGRCLELKCYKVLILFGRKLKLLNLDFRKLNVPVKVFQG